ncbi:probable serine/threonine-protein kinase kinX [Ptychodera flava]|uniref:probable serine/threonine-protein kinase kinX n=1 Tax=Ptychodera flava TaxID=63121 RepID=UPI00396A8F9B
MTCLVKEEAVSWEKLEDISKDVPATETADKKAAPKEALPLLEESTIWEKPVEVTVERPSEDKEEGTKVDIVPVQVTSQEETLSWEKLGISPDQVKPTVTSREEVAIHLELPEQEEVLPWEEPEIVVVLKKPHGERVEVVEEVTVISKTITEKEETVPWEQLQDEPVKGEVKDKAIPTEVTEVSEIAEVDVSPQTMERTEVVLEERTEREVELQFELPKEEKEEEPEPQKPDVKSTIEEITVEQGSVATLECQVSGYPKPEVVWYREGEVVQGKRYTSVFESDGTCLLVIAPVTEEDDAEFECKATNEYGTISTMFEVFVEKVVELPKEKEPTEKVTVVLPSTEVSPDLEDVDKMEESPIVSFKLPTQEEEMPWEKLGFDVKEVEQSVIAEEIPSEGLPTSELTEALMWEEPEEIKASKPTSIKEEISEEPVKPMTCLVKEEAVSWEKLDGIESEKLQGEVICSFELPQEPEKVPKKEVVVEWEELEDVHYKEETTEEEAKVHIIPYKVPEKKVEMPFEAAEEVTPFLIGKETIEDISEDITVVKVQAQEEAIPWEKSDVIPYISDVTEKAKETEAHKELSTADLALSLAWEEPVTIAPQEEHELRQPVEDVYLKPVEISTAEEQIEWEKLEDVERVKPTEESVGETPAKLLIISEQEEAVKWEKTEDVAKEKPKPQVKEGEEVVYSVLKVIEKGESVVMEKLGTLPADSSKKEEVITRATPYLESTEAEEVVSWEKPDEVSTKTVEKEKVDIIEGTAIHPKTLTEQEEPVSWEELTETPTDQIDTHEAVEKSEIPFVSEKKTEEIPDTRAVTEVILPAKEPEEVHLGEIQVDIPKETISQLSEITVPGRDITGRTEFKMDLEQEPSIMEIILPARETTVTEKIEGLKPSINEIFALCNMQHRELSLLHAVNGYSMIYEDWQQSIYYSQHVYFIYKV